MMSYYPDDSQPPKFVYIMDTMRGENVWVKLKFKTNELLNFNNYICLKYNQIIFIIFLI